MSTTPGIILSVTLTGSIVTPLSLKTLTISPFIMPRSSASLEFIRTVCGSISRSQGRLSYCEWARRQKWVVFVHGCYWHAHKGCPKATVPKRNRDFWLAKFESNRARDRRVAQRLRRMGYRVMTIWECQVGNEEKLAARLSKFLAAAGS